MKYKGGSLPFKSSKQKKFLAINKPELYKKWKKRYGSKIVPKKKK